MSVAAADEATPRLVFYGMYDAASASSAPRVRIRLLGQALGRRAAVTMVSGSRWRRLGHGVRLVLSGLRRFDGVYVETATSSAMPWDLWFLAFARASGVPVGIYFRDAYPLHRDLYPLSGLRARLPDLGWRISLAAYRRMASVSFAPSAGLAAALGLPDAVLLPPGTEPDAPDLGAGTEPVVAYVGALTTPVGFDRLVDALRLVRETMPEARLLAIGATPPGSAAIPLPEWVDVRQASRDELPALLASVSVCAIPLPINRYTNLAWPLKLSDYLAFGKPIVATATTETAAALEGSGAGIVVGDRPAEMADGLLRVLRDRELASRLAAASRALALAPDRTWDHRAGVIVERLAHAAARRS
jgi:glycosyltransferase involved in cell wall biosynthesis